MDHTGDKAITFPTDDPQNLFRALADPTRQRLAQLLLVEELNVTQLVEILGQPQSTISRHLRVLRKAGLVQDRRMGTSALYSVVRGNANEATKESSDNLRSMVLGWLESRILPEVMRERLARVLQHREPAGSGFFNRLGRRWDDMRTEAFGSAFSTEAFLSLLPPSWTVADIGTGTGQILPVLSSVFARVIAVEPAVEMLACARQRANEYGLPNVDFYQGDLAEVPIADEACDLAIAILVIHHVREPGDALSEMHRVVKPGGRVLIVEQEEHENQGFYERMQDLWWGFRPADLAQQLLEAGFVKVRHRRLTTAAESSGATESPPPFSY